MKRTEKKMLSAALASNGGGITDWLLPVSTRDRLLKAQYLQHKPNHAGMLTITHAGKAALEAAVFTVKEPK